MTTKRWLLSAVLLIILGTILFSFSACSENGIKGVFLGDYEEKTFEISEDFDDIYIDIDATDVNLLISEDDKCHVVAYTQKNINYSVSVEDGTLKISHKDDRKWYEYVNIVLESSSLTVYLPKSEYSALTLRGSTGDVLLSQNFRFESIDMSVSTGDLNVSASVTGAVSLKATTGDIELSDMSSASVYLSISTGDIEVRNVACEGDFGFDVRTGDVELKNITCGNLYSEGSSGNIEMDNVISSGKMTLERSTGDISLYACDATELYIETTTGDVKGVLLTSKIFNTHSSTGKVDVPETTTGGICKIKVSTGNIIFTIAESLD